MNNFIIFIVGLVVTLIAGMGVITSQVFIAYKSSKVMLEKHNSRVKSAA